MKKIIVLLMLVTAVAFGCDTKPVKAGPPSNLYFIDEGHYITVIHDNNKNNTCYLTGVYGGSSISCVADHTP